MRWLDAFVQDLRYGIRLLARNTGFATATILTVALGIGATSASSPWFTASCSDRCPIASPSDS